MNSFAQKFIVLGISKSGYNAAKYLLSINNCPYIYEENRSEKIDSSIKELTEKGAILCTASGIDEVLNLIDVVIISPGIKITHEVAIKAKSLNKRIISELEFGFFSLMPEIIAVTGTNGKTTTVNLIENIYKSAGKNALLAGNVGNPITSLLSEINKETVCITEVSSFQLESTIALRPHIACILNISPDHLERHFTMENYIYLKKRIMKNQLESEYTILNYDDETVKEFGKETKGKVIWISLISKVKGAYRFEGKLYFNDEFIMDESDLSLKGLHNIYNALFAIATAKIDGIDTNIISSSLKGFKGIPHRIEFVDEIKGVTFCNDSKATNTGSTISAINTIEKPMILLLGGHEKGEKYDDLFNNILTKNIKHIVLYGESRFNMYACAQKLSINNISITEKFDNALKIAAVLAESGDCVLLSPACSSYDEFSSYEERGDKFKEFTESLK